MPENVSTATVTPSTQALGEYVVTIAHPVDEPVKNVFDQPVTDKDGNVVTKKSHHFTFVRVAGHEAKTVAHFFKKMINGEPDESVEKLAEKDIDAAQSSGATKPADSGVGKSAE